MVNANEIKKRIEIGKHSITEHVMWVHCQGNMWYKVIERTMEQES